MRVCCPLYSSRQSVEESQWNWAPASNCGWALLIEQAPLLPNTNLPNFGLNLLAAAENFNHNLLTSPWACIILNSKWVGKPAMSASAYISQSWCKLCHQIMRSDKLSSYPHDFFSHSDTVLNSSHLVFLKLMLNPYTRYKQHSALCRDHLPIDCSSENISELLIWGHRMISEFNNVKVNFIMLSTLMVDENNLDPYTFNSAVHEKYKWRDQPKTVIDKRY